MLNYLIYVLMIVNIEHPIMTHINVQIYASIYEKNDVM